MKDALTPILVRRNQLIDRPCDKGSAVIIKRKELKRFSRLLKHGYTCTSFKFVYLPSRDEPFATHVQQRKGARVYGLVRFRTAAADTRPGTTLLSQLLSTETEQGRRDSI